MRSYLEKLSVQVSFNNGILFYSMWDGYRKKKDITDFLSYMEAKGEMVIPLHTSGHADQATIKAFVKHVFPHKLCRSIPKIQDGLSVSIRS